MKIMILNGSPKKNSSVTLQSMNYLIKKFPDVEFDTIHLMTTVRKGDEAIQSATQQLNNVDGIIWSFPVYHLLVPAHMKVFIEKVFELGLQSTFDKKYATCFSTSIHFYDNTAHEYIEGISSDMGMLYIDGLSHHMQDFLLEEKRDELAFFFDNFLDSIKRKQNVTSQFQPIDSSNFIYIPSMTEEQIVSDQRVTIISDGTPGSNIESMIQKFRSKVEGEVRYYNLWDIEMDNYCIGCCNCAPENICCFHDKDKYRQTLDEMIENSDIVVFASELRDRYFSSRFKLFFDRSFCYTHIPIFAGKQIAFLVSGRINEMAHMREIMYAYGTDSSNYVGVVTDECCDSQLIDSQIEDLVRKSIKYGEKNYIKTAMFQSVGAKKVFTDFVKGSQAGIFVGDYKYYKENGFFEKSSLISRAGVTIFRFLMGLKPFSAKAKQDMYKHMVAAHKKVLNETDNERTK